MGEVILGLPGPWADDNSEPSDHYTTKIGGLPDWPLPREHISKELLMCSVCGAPLSLVLQVYAPIASNNLKLDERVLYVLACTARNCISDPRSWRTLRFQKTKSLPKPLGNVSTSQLSVSSSCDKFLEDPWDFEDDEDDDVNFDMHELGKALEQAASVASGVGKKKDSHVGKRKEAMNGDNCEGKLQTGGIDAHVTVLPCFYVYNEEEPSSKMTSISSPTISFNAKEQNNLFEEESWETEDYEYDKALYVDRVYLKFKKRLDLYPEQCFRYSYGGKSLNVAAELQEPKVCALCGGDCHFELQLMPPLLYFLKQGVESSTTVSSVEDWNWMTVIIYTCAKSCAVDTHSGNHNGQDWIVAEEVTLVQYEECLLLSSDFP